MKIGQWSFQSGTGGQYLTFYAAHESLLPPVEIQGEPSCQPEEWACRITVDPEWTDTETVSDLGDAMAKNIDWALKLPGMPGRREPGR
jgi:hypothetical protein